VLNIDAAGVETLAITNKDATQLDVAGLTATGTTGVSSITIAGAGATVMEGINATTDTIDATSATGGLTVAAAQRTSDAKTIKGGQGVDSLTQENAADVMAGGLGTNDTLVLNYTATMGGIAVDLTAADQVVTFDGSANAASQTGFENVDLSNYNSFGSTVVGVATGSTIVGSAAADNITTGAGGDTITGGAGADIITTGAGADTIVIGANDLTNANRDTVKDYSVANDQIRIDATFTTGNITDGAVTAEYQTKSVATTITLDSTDVIVELSYEFDADVDLDTATKTQFISASGAADDATGSSVTAATLTVNADEDSGMAIAYQDGNAYFFKFTDGANAGSDAAQTILANEGTDLFELVGIYEGIAVGAFVFGEFVA
jgi:Ca2+-binding RTX toxin-like protein